MIKEHREQIFRELTLSAGKNTKLKKIDWNFKVTI